MGRKRVYDDDDGRTIADMSGLERPRLIVPRHWDNVRKPAAAPPPEPAEETPPRPWEQGQDELSAEDRRVYILAAVRAALLIGGVYILGAVLLTLAMLALWG